MYYKVQLQVQEKIEFKDFFQIEKLSNRLGSRSRVEPDFAGSISPLGLTA